MPNKKSAQIKIAYMIATYADLNSLDRLINALDDKNTAFYIHIDKKLKETYTPKRKNVFVLENRLLVNWGCKGMMNAEINLLFAAQKFDPDYYILLSGTDYPIRPPKFLQTLLSKGYDYINICDVPSEGKPLSRFDQSYLFDFDRRKLNSHKYSFKAIDAKILRIIELLIKALHFKKKPPFKLYAGSTWFALTRNSVNYVLETIKKDKRYISFFEKCFIPDEAFLQTILGNSKFKNNIRGNITFTDWTTKKAHPEPINEKHIALFKKNKTFKSSYGKYTPFFARKFDVKNTALLDKIDKELRHC